VHSLRSGSELADPCREWGAVRRRAESAGGDVKPVQMEADAIIARSAMRGKRQTASAPHATMASCVLKPLGPSKGI
jgi:hypothetical protein